MAYDKSPDLWLGAGYSLAANAISLTTADGSLNTLGECTVVIATDVFTVGTVHNLKIGDIVQFTTTGTLPAGTSVLTDYYVLTVPSTTTLTISSTVDGGVLDITDTGSGTHSINSQQALVELTDAEANATTGDIRKIMFAICQKMYESWNNTETADRPTRVVISKSSSQNVTTGIDTNTYRFTFYNSITAQDVADEPS